MFAAVVAGKLGDFVQVSETKFMLSLQPLNDSNHIVVFLTGQTPLPFEMGGGGINSGTSVMWYYMGFICNAKPSAIYRIANLKTASDAALIENPFMSHNAPSFSTGVTAQLGISIEPIETLLQQIPLDSSQLKKSGGDAMRDFAAFAAQNLFDYVSSFSRNLPLQATITEPYVPLSAIKQWFHIFQNKLSLDKNFWLK
ncbi:unnamed protein product [Protopolystoma xenopodis]|uniref:Uncharacterized protein n=1 Tax=Protopolystoma xenopodis TaxID=117903 RepID=A0A3S5CJ37_9PLAT|nr:unnamed protein product [Protopolystoma xenopodis]